MAAVDGTHELTTCCTLHLEETMDRRTFTTALLAALTPAALASAHPGGLDAKGGHHDRKNGGYHIHRAPAPAPAAPAYQPAAAAPAAAGVAWAALSPADKTEALALALVAAGTLTRADLDRAAKQLS